MCRLQLGLLALVLTVISATAVDAAPQCAGESAPRLRGTPLDLTRRATSKAILDLAWDFPVVERFVAPKDKDKAKAKRPRAAGTIGALPVKEALTHIAGKDRRPLLVLRECLGCRDTDAALLSRNLDNEKTLLLARWFHCVKLPPAVLRPDHAFHKLFAEKVPPHLFLARWDGSKKITFSGSQTQSQLWRAMTKMIKAEYEKKPDAALTVMLKMLSTFDHLDSMEEQYRAQIREQIYKLGLGSAKVPPLRKKLAGIQDQKKQAMAKAKAVCDLKLRTR